jgi:hypothetical protein
MPKTPFLFDCRLSGRTAKLRKNADNKKGRCQTVPWWNPLAKTGRLPNRNTDGDQYAEFAEVQNSF